MTEKTIIVKATVCDKDHGGPGNSAVFYGHGGRRDVCVRIGMSPTWIHTPKRTRKPKPGPDTKIIEALRTLPWGLDEDINGADLVDTVYELLANNGRLPDFSPEPKPTEVPRIPCLDCGVGYYIGEDGCRHTAKTEDEWRSVPGNLCQLIGGGLVRHVEPCQDAPNVTNASTGEVVDL